MFTLTLQIVYGAATACLDLVCGTMSGAQCGSMLHCSCAVIVCDDYFDDLRSQIESNGDIQGLLKVFKIIFESRESLSKPPLCQFTVKVIGRKGN